MMLPVNGVQHPLVKILSGADLVAKALLKQGCIFEDITGRCSEW